MAANPNSLPPLPADHLSHPEAWATGADPATDKQKAFVKTLENQHANLVPEGGLDVDGMGKSEASAVIDKLKSGEEVTSGGRERTVGDDKVPQEKEAETEQTESADAGTSAAEEKKETVLPSGPSEAEMVAEKQASELAKQKDEGYESDVDTPGNKADESSVEKKEKGQTTLDDVVMREKDDNAGVKRGKEAEEDEESEVEGERRSKKPRVDNGKVEQKQPTTKNTDGKIVDSKPATSGDLTNPISVDSTPGPPDTQPPPAAAGTPPASTTNGAAGNGNGNGDDSTLPGDSAHLDHPENWTTGDEPATDKQKGFLKVLEKQTGTPAGDVDGMGKSEASEKIGEMKG